MPSPILPASRDSKAQADMRAASKRKFQRRRRIASNDFRTL